MGGWMDGCLDEWVDGSKGGRVDEWVDGWMTMNKQKMFQRM
jgi:hypothetical protein